MIRPRHPNSRIALTNISFRRRQAFESQTVADINTVRLASANTAASLVTLTDTVTTNFNSLDGRILANANQISQRYTKSEADNAITAAIDAYDVGITTKFGQKAEASALNALTNRVTTAEGTITSQSGSITTLSNSLDTKSTNVFSSTAPSAADRLPQTLWIDTTGGNNIPKRWNGSSWVAVRDKAATDALAGLTSKADASALNALTTRVTTAEGTITSQGNSLISLNNSVGRMSAGGRFRMSTQATPTGAQSRIGLHAEASDGQNTHSAGLFLVARTDGTSDVIAAANRFSIATGDGANDARKVPFIVRNGQVEITSAVIGDLTIGRGKVGNGAITGYHHAFAASAVKSSATTSVVIARLAFSKGRAMPLPIWFSCRYPGQAVLYLQRRIGTGAWTTIYTVMDTAYGNNVKNRSGETHTYVDTWTGTGSVSYCVVGYTLGTYRHNTSGRQEDTEIRQSRSVHNISDRFIGALNLHK